MDFLDTEATRDGVQWAWSSDQHDYYTAQWNQDLSMHIWHELELKVSV